MKIMIAMVREVADKIDFIKRNNINLISIRDTSAGTNQVYYDIIDNAGLQNLLVVQFDDLVEFLPPQYNRSELPPSEENIKTILEWAKQKMKENNNDFIVHCTGGVSRSSAVAILIQYLQDPEGALKVIDPVLHSPNEKVLELGDKYLNTNLKEPTKKIIKEHNEEFMENVGKK
jgi:predicted protein tyrosine phosphatase